MFHKRCRCRSIQFANKHCHWKKKRYKVKDCKVIGWSCCRGLGLLRGASSTFNTGNSIHSIHSMHSIQCASLPASVARGRGFCFLGFHMKQPIFQQPTGAHGVSADVIVYFKRLKSFEFAGNNLLAPYACCTPLVIEPGHILAPCLRTHLLFFNSRAVHYLHTKPAGGVNGARTSSCTDIESC